MFVSFAAIVLPALIMFLLDRRKEIRHLKLIWVVLTIMHLVPVFAFVMSGFSNIANRFCFGYALLNVFIAVIELSRIRELTKIKAIIVIAAVLAYSIAAYLLQSEDSREIWPYVITFGTTLIVAVIALLSRKKVNGGNRLISFFCLIMTCVSVAYTATFIYHNIYLTQFYKNGMDTIKTDYLYSAGISETIKNDTEYYRVDGNAVPYKGSASGFHFGVNTMTGYPYFGWSRGYEKWISEMELARFHNKHRFLGINARPQMLTLSSVKYFINAIVCLSLQSWFIRLSNPFTALATAVSSPLLMPFSFKSITWAFTPRSLKYLSAFFVSKHFLVPNICIFILNLISF